ncbi:hypothetical protein ACHFCA_10385 [Delftia tsuruhatensis]
MSQFTYPIEGVRVTHEITSNHHAHAMTHVAEPIIEILSAYGQRNGNTFALYGGLYAMGCALASVGANLEPGVPFEKDRNAVLMNARDLPRLADALIDQLYQKREEFLAGPAPRAPAIPVPAIQHLPADDTEGGAL